MKKKNMMLKIAYEQFLMWRDKSTYEPINHSVSETCEVFRLC